MLVFAFLVVLPFIAETAPKNALFETFADFIPSRLVLTGFHYNEWNLFASPMTVMLTLVILACYVGAAQDRRDRSEAVLFGTVAVFVVVAQLVFLARGHTFVHPWDGAEIMELIMDIGLAVFTLQTTARLIARYGHRPQAR